MSKKIKEVTDTTTEERIKNAARIIFHRKGFAATRTRDIADEAGINLALLNYYFRSKKKLFEIIMLESLQHFFSSISVVFNNEKTSLDKKIETLAINYIDLFTAQPNIPLFVLNELKTNPEELILKMDVKGLIMKSYFIKQLQEAIKKDKIAAIHPLHFIMNIIGLIVFPFAGSPLLKSLSDMKKDEYNDLMQQRKLLIPKWIKAMMKVK